MEMALRVQERAFRRLPLVDAWQLQFASGTRGRYKFLVLNGQSQTGKTRFARALVGDADRVWYCDCVAGTPDLRGFSKHSFDLIIYDELGPGCAVALKKLLQSGNDTCLLGVSPTMQFAYQVVAHGVRQVICTNVWAAELKLLPSADREWLELNSVFAQVDAPLWES